MSERHNFSLMLYTPYGLYPAAGEFFLENVIFKVSQTHFSKGGGGGNEVPCMSHVRMSYVPQYGMYVHITTTVQLK